MRALLPILLASSALSVLGLAAACGSSPTSSNSAASGTDASSMAESGSGSGSSSGGQSDGASPSDAGTSTDAGDGGACPAVTGTFSPAAHGPLPTMAWYGGPVLPSPLVVTFTFQDTPNATALDAFGASVASTPWFTEVTKDYCIPDGGTCISAGPPGKAVPIAANADATYVDNGGISGVDAGAGTNLNQFINQQIAAAVTAGTIPAPDGNAVYMFYFPPSTTITGIVGTSCSNYGAYHDNQTYSDGKTTIAYAIVPDCASGSANELNSVTVAASHELAEATTDPTPSSTTPAWYLDVSSYPEGGTTQPQYRNDPWMTQGYGEVGDNCESVHSRTLGLMGDAGPFVQRIWSTSAAAGGHDPCVPTPAALGPYFNASTDKAIYVASVGETITIDVSPFSDAQRASWQLDALDYTPGQYTGMNHYLKFEFVDGALRSDGVAAKTCVNNGAQVQLKVTLLADPASDTSLQQPYEEWPEAVGAVSSVDESQTVPVVPTRQVNSHFWVFSVVTPATAAMIGVPSGGISDMMRRRHHARSPHLALEP